MGMCNIPKLNFLISLTRGKIVYKITKNSEKIDNCNGVLLSQNSSCRI